VETLDGIESKDVLDISSETNELFPETEEFSSDLEEELPEDD
jgi:hypothetical protein